MQVRILLIKVFISILFISNGTIQAQTYADNSKIAFIRQHNVKSIKVTSYPYIKGEPSKKGVLKNSYHYDMEGKLIDVYNYLPDGSLVSQNKYIYNLDDSLITFQYFSITGGGNSTTRIEYEASGLRKAEYFQKSGNNVLSATYSYNKLKLPAEVTLFIDPFSGKTGKVTYEYDQNNRLVSLTRQNIGKIPFLKEVFYYDSAGALTGITSFDEDQTIRKSIKYKYAQKGKIIEIFTEEMNSSEKRLLFYNSKRMLIEEKVSSSAKGMFLIKYEYEYY
ncbi:MAG: hypothetical protein HXY49_01050 [Ignavibacteriaceae bacterium]|nr:hypothetical protein [Ignavibacteriaceae bacterium]